MSRSSGQPGSEVEVKLPVSDAAEGLRRLRLANFEMTCPRVFEANTVYDTPGGALRKTRQLLRIRIAGERTLLTYKGPPSAARHKTREEIETELPDPDTVPAILERLGYQPKFRYEKYRTEFARPGEDGVAVLDETPIGVYLELEGDAEWIDRTAPLLGFGPEDYVTDSYAALFFKSPMSSRSEHMVFGPNP